MRASGSVVLDTNESSLHAALSLKAERLCHYADSEDAHFLRDPCNDGSSSGSCAAAHTAGNEYHIRTLESLSDLISTLFRCLLTNLRIRTGAKALRQLLTDLQQSGSPAKVQSLNISVDTDEFHTYNIYIHHSVNSVVSVVACTANANDYNLASRFRIICFDFQHGWPLLILKNNNHVNNNTIEP